MQADVNGNPVLLEFEEFKKLDLPERRQVLFSFLVAGAKVTSILNAFKPNKEKNFEKKVERTTLAHVNGR